MRRLIRKMGVFLPVLILFAALNMSVGCALTVDDVEVFILEAPANTVYFIYSDTAASVKPLKCVRASPIDWTATGYVKGVTRNVQVEALDTDGSLIDQSTGAPRFSDMSVVMSGGPIVQVLVRYYEANKVAPVYFGVEGGKYYWYRRDGTRIDATGLTPTCQNDMFIVEHFLDGNGNAVLVVYGYTGVGTFAGARFFTEVIRPNIRSYVHAYYIYHWTDLDGDYFPDLSEVNPTPVAYGD